MKLKFRKILNSGKKALIVALVAFLTFPWGAEAGLMTGALFGLPGLEDPSIDSFFSEAEDRYGIDKDSIRKAGIMTRSPEVKVFIDKTSPEPGEKVTATAVPVSFTNTQEQLYFTWFLVHTDPDTGEPTNTMEEAKREAMGIVARGGFDPDIFGVDYDQYRPGEDLDRDGFRAALGGSNGVGAKKVDDKYEGRYEGEKSVMADPAKGLLATDKISRCFLHNFGNLYGGDSEVAGRDMIVECKHEFPRCGNDICLGGADNKFDNADEEYWRLDPENADTDGDGVPDEADLAGLGQSRFSWSYQSGDQVGVIVEGTSIKPINEKGSDDEGSGGGDSSVSMSDCDFTITENQADPADPSSNTTYDFGAGTFLDCLNDKAEEADSGETVDRNFTETLRSYNKIMWAAIRFCGEEDLDFIEGDGCDDDEDIGLPFLATIPVTAQGKEQMKVDVTHIPSNPQFNTIDGTSDSITLTASVDEDGVSEDFLYYEWNIKLCTSGSDCQEDVTNEVEFEGSREGLGVNEITFRATEDLMREGRALIKPIVVVKNHQDSSMKSVGWDSFEIAKNDMQVRIYEAEFDGGQWSRGEEICKEGLYSQLCPVYPFQVLMVDVDADSDLGQASSFSWQVNGQRVTVPRECLFSGKAGCKDDPTKKAAFFMVDGFESDVGTISVRANRKNKGELVSSRTFSVMSPRAIISPTSATVKPKVYTNARGEQEQSSDIYEALAGSMVKFEAEKIVPTYLPQDGWTMDPQTKEYFNQNHDGMVLTWFINGQPVNQELIENYPDLKISTDGKSLEFMLAGKYGTGMEVGVQLEKTFPDQYYDSLYQAWGVTRTHTLVTTNASKVNVVFASSEEVGSLPQFLASVYSNAPKYLVLSMRLAIVLVMIWGSLLLFSHSMGIKRQF